MLRRMSRGPIRRRAYTLIEVLVGIAILGVLAALIIPAIGAVRETSRRATCLNHLHQMGVAWESAAAAYGRYPTADLNLTGYARLLRHLEQRTVADSLESGSFANDTLPLVEVFLCPSDPVPYENENGSCSYLMNDGTKFRYTLVGGNYAHNGFTSGRTVDTHPREITDGLSQTAAMSERLVVRWQSASASADELQRETGRYYGWTPRQHFLPGEEPLAAAMCRDEIIPPTTLYGEHNCQQWRCQIGYDHLLTPNRRACYNAVDFETAEDATYLLPPSSLHPGGVNLLMADKRVTFVSDSIDEKVWNAIGTRNGAEPVTWRD